MKTSSRESRTYVVPGMHCVHCEHAVKHEVARVSGVRSVDVDLAAKLVTVNGEELSDPDIRNAIDEAGYEAMP